MYGFVPPGHKGLIYYGIWLVSWYYLHVSIIKNIDVLHTSQVGINFTSNGQPKKVYHYNLPYRKLWNKRNKPFHHFNNKNRNSFSAFIPKPNKNVQPLSLSLGLPDTAAPKAPIDKMEKYNKMKFNMEKNMRKPSKKISWASPPKMPFSKRKSTGNFMKNIKQIFKSIKALVEKLKDPKCYNQDCTKNLRISPPLHVSKLSPSPIFNIFPSSNSKGMERNNKVSRLPYIKSNLHPSLSNFQHLEPASFSPLPSAFSKDLQSIHPKYSINGSQSIILHSKQSAKIKNDSRNQFEKINESKPYFVKNMNSTQRTDDLDEIFDHTNFPVANRKLNQEFSINNSELMKQAKNKVDLEYKYANNKRKRRFLINGKPTLLKIFSRTTEGSWYLFNNCTIS